MRAFHYHYHEPATLVEALSLLEGHGDSAHVLAGGTALVPLMRSGLVLPEHVVALERIPNLREIGIAPDGGLSIGALVTHREIERSALVERFFAPLAETFGRVATIRIRNQGTIGGNVIHADPASDPPPMLLALDAQAVIASGTTMRTAPLAEFFRGFFETALGRAEIVTTIHIPPPMRGARGVYLKFLPGSEDDFATVSVATVVHLEDGVCRHARIGLGAVGSTPLRARRAEAVLLGSALSPKTIAEAAAIAKSEVEPYDDARGSANYKRRMVEVFVRRALERLRAA